MHRRTLYRLTYLAAGLSLGHHLDHVIRHNAVGWPLTDQVNAFTLSLVVYLVIASGLLVYRAGRVGPGFWGLVSGGGVFVSAVHFGPAAVEPPELILGHYDPPILGSGRGLALAGRCRAKGQAGCRSHGLDHRRFVCSEITPILRPQPRPMAWEQRG